MKKLFTAAALLTTLLVVGCSDADIASHNISKAADNFEIQRRIVFINGITDRYMLTIEGLCSLGNRDTPGKMSVTCKTAESKYKKHYLGLSDNVTFVSEQLDAEKVSAYHYRLFFKPQALVPDVDFRGNKKELLK
jgi:hypothetical protein